LNFRDLNARNAKQRKWRRISAHQSLLRDPATALFWVVIQGVRGTNPE
jgi:hypothetical protein